MKPNHHSLAYKQQKQRIRPIRIYRKQKMKIADWMFQGNYAAFYKENEIK